MSMELTKMKDKMSDNTMNEQHTHDEELALPLARSVRSVCTVAMEYDTSTGIGRMMAVEVCFAVQSS